MFGMEPLRILARAGVLSSLMSGGTARALIGAPTRESAERIRRATACVRVSTGLQLATFRRREDGHLVELWRCSRHRGSRGRVSHPCPRGWAGELAFRLDPLDGLRLRMAGDSAAGRALASALSRRLDWLWLQTGRRGSVTGTEGAAE